MKSKISISISKELLNKLDARLEDGLFRNKSHIIEYAVNQFLEDKDEF